MAVIDGRLVYRDGANVPGAPATSYQIADDFSGYFQGAPGDFLYVKSANGLWISNGTSWFQVYSVATPPPAPPTPTFSSIYIDAPYNLSDNDDVIICGPNTLTVRLHSASIAKRKRYTIKSWWQGSVTISTNGEDIDASTAPITIYQPASVTLVPVSASWAII